LGYKVQNDESLVQRNVKVLGSWHRRAEYFQ
jgi:hypothetical protein